jgi:hypothetical protein
MLRHTVMFSWNDDAPDDQVDIVTAALAELPATIAEIRSYVFGPDAGIVEGNADYVVVADFDDAAGFLTYRDHPAHQQFITDHIAGKIAGRSAVQFEL